MPFPHRPVYRHPDLKRLLNPASIAVHGVSPNPASFGAKGFNNLKRFSGKAWRVNPKYQEIDGDKCYASIRSLPEPPDCVLIALPRPAVEEAVLECAEAGVGGVVIFASGYLETGKADRIEGTLQVRDLVQQTVGASNRLFAISPKVSADPANSTFLMTRAPAGTTCDRLRGG